MIAVLVALHFLSPAMAGRQKAGHIDHVAVKQHKPTGDQGDAAASKADAPKAKEDAKPGATAAAPVVPKETQPAAPECPGGRTPDAKGSCFTGCPPNSVNTVPDSEGNCECAKEYICFDGSVLSTAESLSKELSKPENGKQILE